MESDDNLAAQREREAALPKIRRLVLIQAREKGVNLSDISKACGRYPGYIHGFIWKGTPKRLDEDARRIVAKMLELPEDALRDTPLPPYLAQIEAARVTASAVAGAPGAPVYATRPVPLFREDEPIDAAQAQQWAPPFAGVGSPAACAIWIDTPHARLHPGDVAYAKSDQPARVGDLVVVLNLADCRIADIGELVSLTASEVRINSGIEAKTHERCAVKVLKIVGIALP